MDIGHVSQCSCTRGHFLLLHGLAASVTIGERVDGIPRAKIENKIEITTCNAKMSHRFVSFTEKNLSVVSCFCNSLLC